MTQPATAENSPKPGTSPKPRIQTLSDLIFGLALSIGAVSLLNSKPANLNALVASLLLFGFSFLIIAIIWTRYTRIMSALPVEKESLFIANFVLLFLVSLEPYLYNLISTQPIPGLIDPEISSAALGIDMGLMTVILAYFTHQLTIEDRKLIPADLMKSYRSDRSMLLLRSAIFLGSAIPIFNVYERFVLWGLTFLTYVVRRLLE